MSVTSRLDKLEITAASIPRTVEQLVSDYENRVTDRRQDSWWFASLSEAEGKLLSAECDRRYPHLLQLTAEEWRRVLTMDAEEIGQLAGGDLSILRA